MKKARTKNLKLKSRLMFATKEGGIGYKLVKDKKKVDRVIDVYGNDEYFEWKNGVKPFYYAYGLIIAPPFSDSEREKKLIQTAFEELADVFSPPREKCYLRVNDEGEKKEYVMIELETNLMIAITFLNYKNDGIELKGIGIYFSKDANFEKISKAKTILQKYKLGSSIKETEAVYLH